MCKCQKVKLWGGGGEEREGKTKTHKQKKTDILEKYRKELEIKV